ncbi:MAG TPA: undecaprenyl-diphosphate phosphatase [Armatimonadota bacterium]|nr:undecaprenyl-diphosphate phosphatase [Armatimonadota bacterium]
MLTHILQAAFLGLVQGITEPLPVSSTAHLVLFEKLFGWSKATYGLSFDMFINMGTTAAVISFFWSDLRKMARHFRLPGGDPLNRQERLPWLIILASIPVGLIGLALEKRIATVFRSPLIIAYTLIGVGLLMFLAEWYARRQKHSKTASDKQVVGIGLSQALALVPGVSRSGITIATGLLYGLDRVEAAEISFLLSIPITLAAIGDRLVKFGLQLGRHLVSPNVLIYYIIGAIASWAAGFLTLRFLLRFYSRYTLATFAYYRIALGIVILLFFR